MTSSTPRRTVLAAALAAAARPPRARPPPPPPAAAAADRTAAAAAPAPASAAPRRPSPAWTTTAGPRTPTGAAARAAAPAPCPGPPRPASSARPAGTTDYTDPHTGTTATWEYATWTSPVAHASRSRHRADRLLERPHPGRHLDPGRAARHLHRRHRHPLVRHGPLGLRRRDDDIRRTSVDGQTDGRSTIWTDTFAIDDAAARAPLLASYRLRLTLYRTPGTARRRRVAARRDGLRHPGPLHRAGLRAGRRRRAASCRCRATRRTSTRASTRSTTTAARPGAAPPPRRWSSSTGAASPTADDLSWVNPDYADPQVCHARPVHLRLPVRGLRQLAVQRRVRGHLPRTWRRVVTRLSSLNDVETLIRAGIPVITSQSFLATELDGAGYGTSGPPDERRRLHPDGDVIANDPASPDDDGGPQRLQARASSRTSGCAPSATTPTARSRAVRAASATCTSRSSQHQLSTGCCAELGSGSDSRRRPDRQLLRQISLEGRRHHMAARGTVNRSV